MAIDRNPRMAKLNDPRMRAVLYYSRKRRLARIAAATVPPVIPIPAKWNPDDKDSTVALSNSDRTATKITTSGWVSVRSVRSQSSGKYYVEFEFTLFTSSFVAAGLGTSAMDLANYAGAGTTSIGLVSNGQRFVNAVAISTIASFVNGDILGMAVDLTARKIWFRKNNLAFNTVIGGAQDPAAGSGGIALHVDLTGDIFLVASVQSVGNNQTINPDSATYVYTAPTGFEEW